MIRIAICDDESVMCDTLEQLISLKLELLKTPFTVVCFSRTRALLDAFREGYRETHPDDACTCLRVSELGLKPLTEEALRERDALAARQAFSVSSRTWSLAL